MRARNRAVLIALLALACSRGPGPEAPRRAFYYWRTTLRLSPAEARALADLRADRLYVRLFDLDWADGERAPRVLGPLVVGGPLPAGLDVVPVVYLRARVLHHLGDAAGVAGELWNAVERHVARLGRRPRELQIDCDWAPGDRDAYFALLSALSARLPPGTILSATIRLHQVKYRERTGVPPVARGMLMFYNMGPIDADPEAHAIFDPARAGAYLARVADYPLPLDVALPMWSWVVHVRGDEVEGLLQDTEPAELADKPWLRPLGHGRFEVRESSFLHGVLLREGDYLDAEETTPAVLEAAAAAIAPRLATGRGQRTISLFHLSERNLARHEPKELARVFARFR